MPRWVVRFPAVGRRIMQTMTVPYSIISHLFEAFRATKRDGMGARPHHLPVDRQSAWRRAAIRAESRRRHDLSLHLPGFRPMAAERVVYAGRHLRRSTIASAALQRVRRPKSGSAQSPIPIHSRQTVRSAAMITGPRKRPTNPNDVSPPRIPISASRKGSRVVPPMSAG